MTSKTLSGLTARALVLGVAGAAFGAVGAGTAAAQEAGPRLSGTFSMISRITEESGDFETPRGTERFDYRFLPRCSRGACDVTFVREAGRVRLERDGRRLYRGVSTRPASSRCGGELRQAFTVRVVESRGGIARRIEGTIKATLTGGACTGESTRVFRGNRRAARSPRFTG
jgi:hypothetical protein